MTLCREMGTKNYGTEQDMFKSAAEQHGLVAVALHGNTIEYLEKALKVGLLAIADLQLWEEHDCNRNMAGENTSGHYVVVFKIDKDSVYFMDPWPGKYCKLSRESFKQRWHNSTRGLSFDGTAIYIGKKPKSF
jgi:uncharacterized protein YvpB